MENAPKISWAEAYFLIAFAIIADLLNWIPIVNWIITAITLPAFQLYFTMKGVRGLYALVANGLELIPALSALPLITAGIIGVIIVDRVESSKLGQTAIKSTGAAGKLAEKAVTKKTV